MIGNTGKPKASKLSKCLFWGKKRTILLIFLVLLFPLRGALAGVIGGRTDTSTFKLSFSERFRFVSWDNAVNLDKSLDNGNTFTRHRTSLMAQWLPNTHLEFAVKLTNEYRYYFVPDDREFNLNEIFVDNMYLKWQNPGNLPVTMTLGRQNIMLGEGFVVMDGHPLDGSRSIYFNAARFDVSMNKNNKLILFYTYQPETDNLLPIINNKHQALIEQPEQGFGAYFVGKYNKLNLETYLIRKNIRSTENKHNDSRINTLGSRFVIPFSDGLSLTGEGAFQFGSYGDFDRLSLGGYFYLDYNAASLHPRLPTLTVGAIYLAGDNPKTERMEGWDPLFSRWPKWSESYIYTLIPEYDGRVAYWSNFISIYETLNFRIKSNFNFVFTYHHLKAAEIAAIDRPFLGGRGKTRGDLFITKAVIKINKYFSSHLLWETFTPGNFYREDAVRYNWFRFELMFKI